MLFSNKRKSNKTIEEVLVTFNDIINDLDSIAIREDSRQDALATKAMVIAAKIKVSEKEATDASRIAGKLKDLVS